MKKEETEKILDSINFPQDIRNLPEKKIPQLCDEVREFLIESIAETGGHFGSNLGVVELTVALHRVFDTPNDLLVWDVGHQAYPHKILTGRKGRLKTIRKKGGLAPFPKREESQYDSLSVGHTSTSISAALGMTVAHQGEKEAPQVVAVIGDGALAGGMALEALNHSGDIEADLLVILNDNKMSISPNVGGIRKHLTRLISSPLYVYWHTKGNKFLRRVPMLREFIRRADKYIRGMITHGTLFEELGFKYYGPIDGHDIKTLLDVLINLKKVKGPKFLHIITKKGKGYLPAEQDEFSLHAVKPFDVATGQIKKTKPKVISYSDVFSDWICAKAEKDNKLHSITPAMGEGSGLAEFRKKFPERFHDVGIAEQHAVTFAVGLACEGKRPVVSIYSSFLQRAYDQFIHDVAYQNLNILFAIDRAGIVGPDGATHNGSFDLSFMRIVPNLIVMVPANKNECYSMLETGYRYKGPVAIRYPRGGEKGEYNQKAYLIEIGKAKIIQQGTKIAILSFGAILEKTKKVAQKLEATLINMRFVKPLDEELLKNLAQEYDFFITVEDNTILGGAGSAVNEFVLNNSLEVKVKNIGLPDKFLGAGTREEILADNNLNEEKILKTIEKFIS